MSNSSVTVKDCKTSHLNGRYVLDVNNKTVVSAMYVKDDTHQIYQYKGVWRIAHHGKKVYCLLDVPTNRKIHCDIINFQNRDNSPIYEKNCDIVLDKMKLVFPKKNIDSYDYSPIKGVYPSNINMYTEFIHDRAKAFFAVMDSSGIDYCVFAGSSIGMVRNHRNAPWVDDYDIIIFKESISKFEKDIVPLLRENSFICYKPNKRIERGGYHVLSHTLPEAKPQGIKYFQVDVFYSFFGKDGILRNTHNWGRYHKSNLTRDMVLPFRRRKFHDDMTLPFMNNVIEEVKRSYGDVINDCVIFSHEMDGQVVYDDWEQCVTDFDYIIERANENTRRKIYRNKNYSPKNKLNVLRGDSQFNTEIDILTHISVNNIGTVYIFDDDFLQKYAWAIRYYYPNIKIEYFAYEKNNKILRHFSAIDHLKVKNKELLDYYQNPVLLHINKPKMSIIKLITFGTFDLFHIGHNNIFKRCIEYSERIVVGLSTDKFTYEKKNIYPHDSYAVRKSNILKQNGVIEVFSEESMELKAKYIKKRNPDIFIMGDDWKGKFDWVNCCVIYPPRTPGISSTMLRENKKML
jgi:glycerol-3-phosphate cytidylyltransferase